MGDYLRNLSSISMQDSEVQKFGKWEKKFYAF